MRARLNPEGDVIATYLGIDLASEPHHTGVCTVTVEPATRRPRIHVEPKPLSDMQLCERIIDADMTGIDVPFGWPQAFVSAFQQHAAGAWTPTDHGCARRDRCAIRRDRGDDTVSRETLKWRVTDRVVRKRHKWDPLSVSASRSTAAGCRAR